MSTESPTSYSQTTMRQMDGALIIDKPAGLTSHDVVSRTRHILHERRVGHTGTLDPFATGVLVLLIGRATRLAQFLSGLDKEYEAVIRLGFATDTGDLTGKPLPATSANARLELGDSSLAIEQIEAAFAGLSGEIDQVPPMYSAKKQQGRKLYELARRGEEVERSAVRVWVREFETIEPAHKLLKENSDRTFDLKVRVVCSAGTYVRTLAEDFGKRLGMGAHLAELRRTRVGSFNLQRALTLAELQENVADASIGKVLLSPDETISHLPAINLSAADVLKIRRGVNLRIEDADYADGDHVRLRDEDGQLVAIGSFAAPQQLMRPRVVLAHDEK